MTIKAEIIYDRDFITGEVDAHIFGAFIEHWGRAIYGGIYEPGHPLADEQGFRNDVLDLVRDLRVPIVRYPGGNFASGYKWTDGIGPRSERPRRLDLAWESIETNEIGIDEFVDWAKKAGAEVMAAVNLGTGTPYEAGNMIEYCNHPSGTYWSDLRIRNGHREPHNIKTWCLGNEMDGEWEICRMDDVDYGKKAREAAKIMRVVDPSIKLVACGSSTPQLSTFPEWDRVVLEHVYEYVDYLSMHRYYCLDEGLEVKDFLASFADMDRYIHVVVSTIDYVKAKKRSKKTVYISFDEWNIWYWNNRKVVKWKEAPPQSEDKYTLLDALVLGGLLCTLLNNADRVKMACLAQIVNVIAPIVTKKGGAVLKQSIYYPFQQVSMYGRGKVLKPCIKCPHYESRVYGDVPVLQTACTYKEEERSISIFILNCSQLEDIFVTLDFRAFGRVEAVEHIIMDGTELFAANTFEEPLKVTPRNIKIEKGAGNRFEIKIPRLSWNVIRYELLSEQAGIARVF